MTAAQDPRTPGDSRDPRKRESAAGPSPDSGGGEGDSLREQLSQLVAGELSGTAADALRARIDADDALAREYQALADAWRLFDVLPPVEPSTDLQESVLGQVRAAAASPANAEPDGASHAGSAGSGTGATAVSPASTTPPNLSVRPLTPSEDPDMSPSERGRTSFLRGAWQAVAPLAMAAALLIAIAVALHDPGIPPVDPVSDADGSIGGTDRDLSAGAPGVPGRPDDGSPSEPVGDAGANGAPALAVAAGLPDNPFGPVAMGPEAPEPINPVVRRDTDAPAETRFRYRTLDSADWQPMAGQTLGSLNAEIAVPAGRVEHFTFGEATLAVDGGVNGTVFTLVPDPGAGTDADGRPQGVMIEALQPSRIWVDTRNADAGADLSLRTPTALVSVGNAAGELAYEAGGQTRIAVANGTMQLANLQLSGEMAHAVIREGETATMSLLAQPAVQRHLNTSWIGNWAAIAGLQQNLEVELPIAAAMATQPRVSRTAAVGTLVASDPDHANVPFVIESHDVQVSIAGQVATTTVTEVFHNTTGRTMEGVFYFPIPDGASIAGFRMWIGGQPVEGEFVERQEARRIYDFYRSRGIDPALLEWMEGNTFRMSVFPILPDEHKKLQLVYTEPLHYTDGALGYTYPMVSEKLRGNPVRHFSLAVDVETGTPAQVASTSHRVNAESFANVWRASLEADNYVPGRDFSLTIRPESATPFTSFAQKLAEREGHVAAFITPDFAAAGMDREAGKTVLMVDTSGSMNNERYHRQLAVLDAVLAGLPDDELVAVVTYDYTPASLFGADTDTAFVPATEAQRRVTVAALADRMRYGATNLKRALRHVWINLLDPHEANTVILLGDGIATQGEVKGPRVVESLRQQTVAGTEQTAADLGLALRVFPIALGNSYDAAMLEALATGFDGRVVMAPDATPATDVAAELHARMTVPMLTDVTVAIEPVGGSTPGIGEIWPAHFPALVSGEQISVTAQYAQAGEAEIVLTGRIGDREVEYRWDLALPAEAGSTGISRYWARRAIDGRQAQIDAMPGNTDVIRNEIVELSKSFAVSSRHTSLLVLERDDMFDRWNIERVNQAAADIRPDEGEPTVTVTSTSGNVRIRPAGDGEWIPFHEYVERFNTREVRIGTRIATDFNARAAVRVEDGDHVAINGSSVLDTREVPGAAAVWAAWQEETAQPVDPGTDTPDEPVEVTPEFRERVDNLVEQMRRVRQQLLEQRREETRQLMRDDRDAALEAIDRFEAAVAPMLDTDEHRESLQQQVAAFRELLTTDEDPLVVRELLHNWSLGYTGHARFGENANSHFGRLATLAADHEGGEASGAVERRLNAGGGSGPVAVEDQDGAAMASPADMDEVPATGSDDSLATHPEPDQQGGEVDRGIADNRRADREFRDEASRPMDDPGGADRWDGNPSPSMAPQPDAPRESMQAQQAGQDEPHGDPAMPGEPGFTGPAGNSPANHEDPDDADNASNEMVDEVQNTLEQTRRVALGIREALKENGEELRARIESRLQADLQVIANASSRELFAASLLPPVAPLVRVSTMVERYTGRVIERLRAINGPLTGELEFAPQGARLLHAMASSRADSMAGLQQADAPFTQAANGLTVFALDCSYTMREPLTEAQRNSIDVPETVRETLVTKFDHARHELLAALGALQPGERFAVLLFAREIHYVSNHGEIRRFDSDNASASVMTAGSTTRIARTVNRLSADDTNNLPGLLQTLWADGLFDADAPEYGRVTYVITDGWASWSPDSTGYLPTTGLGNGDMLAGYEEATFDEAFHTRQEQRSVFVHTVGVGNHNGDYLGLIARNTGGEYIDATGGFNSGEKVLADERPADRIQRSVAELRHQARNVHGWTSLIDWACGPLVDDNDLALKVWLEWAGVYPHNHIIYEELGEWLEDLGRPDDALRAFSNIVETGWASPETHRYLGNFYRARDMFEEARDEYRLAREFAKHLAIAYFNEASVEQHMGNYTAAYDLLAEILEHDWPARFQNVHRRAEREMVLLAQTARQAALANDDTVIADQWQHRIETAVANSEYLRQFIASQAVVVLDWDTDGTDIDLWLIQNGNEAGRCYYSTKQPGWGARLWEDLTNGFGPEFITLNNADETAEYMVKIHYYSSHGNNIRAWCHVRVFLGLGTDDARIIERHVKLPEDDAKIPVYTFRLDGSGEGADDSQD